MKTFQQRLCELDKEGLAYSVCLYLNDGSELKGPVIKYTDDSVAIDNGRPGMQTELHIPFSSILWSVIRVED